MKNILFGLMVTVTACAASPVMAMLPEPAYLESVDVSQVPDFVKAGGLVSIHAGSNYIRYGDKRDGHPRSTKLFTEKNESLGYIGGSLCVQNAWIYPEGQKKHISVTEINEQDMIPGHAYRLVLSDYKEQKLGNMEITATWNDPKTAPCSTRTATITLNPDFPSQFKGHILSNNGQVLIPGEPTALYVYPPYTIRLSCKEEEKKAWHANATQENVEDQAHYSVKLRKVKDYEEGRAYTFEWK